MNNKGFGLTEVIVFIVTSLITLVICVIVYDKNFGNITKVDTSDTTQIIGETVKEEIIDDINTKNNREYMELVEKMVNASKIYISNNYTGKTDRITIKLSKLVGEDYIDQLMDPNDAETICTGYIIYDGVDYYEPYLKCGTNYQSNNYNSEFE